MRALRGARQGRVAATLRLANLTACGAEHVDELGRLLCHLTCHGVFAEPSPGRFTIIETADLLRSDHPSGMRMLLDHAERRRDHRPSGPQLGCRDRDLAAPSGGETTGIVGAMLKPGDKAPDFTLLDQDSEQVSLSGQQGHKVLVYFYP